MPLILFILAPFATFVYSCANLRSRVNQIVFVLFFGLFGFCHTFDDIRTDSYRKYESFSHYDAKSVDEIASDFDSGETRDVFEDVLYSCVKSFTESPHIMMMIVGLFGGFFYMLVVKRFLEDRKMEYTWPIAILLAFMVIDSQLPLMGGIRNFSAFALFMSSMLGLLLDNKRWWLIGLLVTPLIHFGYIIAVAATIVVWLVKIPNGILHYLALVVCVASLFLDTSSYVGAVDMFIGSMDNEAIADRVENYSEEETEDEFNTSLTTRLIRVNNQLSALFFVALLIYLRRNRDSLRQTNYELKLYNLLLFFTIISFALISFSVVGQRFVYIAMVLLYLYLLNVYQHNCSSAIRIFIVLMPAIYALHIAWVAYNCYSVTGTDIYYLPLPALFLQ